MVKTTTIHKCEICNWNYNNFEKAQQCESGGVEEPIAKVGDIVDYFQEGIEGWDDSDMHLTNLVILDVKVNKFNPHNLKYVLGWVSSSGELIEDQHACVESNYEFEKYCTVKRSK